MTSKQTYRISILKYSTYNNYDTHLEYPFLGKPRIEYVGQWPDEDKQAFAKDMALMENFISPAEEESFLKELEPYLKRLRYEFDHWDDVRIL